MARFDITKTNEAVRRLLEVVFLVRLGETERAKQTLAELGEPDRECGKMCMRGRHPVFWRTWLGHMSARREDRLTPTVPTGQPATASTRP